MHGARFSPIVDAVLGRSSAELLALQVKPCDFHCGEKHSAITTWTSVLVCAGAALGVIDRITLATVRRVEAVVRWLQEAEARRALPTKDRRTRCYVGWRQPR